MRHDIYTHANIHLIIETNKYIQMFLMIKIKREKRKKRKKRKNNKQREKGHC